MNVERDIDNIDLTQEQISLLIREAFPNHFSIEGNLAILSGGAINSTYKFKIEKEDFVLRVYARDRACCKIEQEVLDLISTKISIPHLIYSNECHEPWAYAIFRFMPGIHIYDASDESKISLSYELGKTLALIHSFKFPKAGLFGNGIAIGRPFPKNSSPYFEEAFTILSKMGNARRRLSDPLADEMRNFMMKNKDFFPRIDSDICLVHSDFKPVNLLYNPDGKITVLDWEFAHAGASILDFAILLRHHEQFPLNVDSLKRGYTDFGGILPDEWIRSAFITDFINIATMLDVPAERPQLFHQLKKAARNTIDQWDSLDSLTFNTRLK